MNSNLIITISIGHRPWFNNIKKYYQLYANKTNSDFMVIDDNFQGDIKSRLKKFEIVKYLDKYDRILFLDDTCIITPNCPNVFNIVPKELLGVICEKPPFFNKYHILKQSLEYYQVSDNSYEENHIWFNSGFILFSSIHKQLFEIPIIPIKKIGSYLDQAIFNANRHKYNFPILDLGLRYNYMGTRISEQNPYKINDLDNIYIYHITRAWSPRKRLAKFNEILSILN
jgi:hypothetical protein